MSDEDSLRLALTGSVQYLPLHLQSDMQMLYHMLHWNTVEICLRHFDGNTEYV